MGGDDLAAALPAGLALDVADLAVAGPLARLDAAATAAGGAGAGHAFTPTT
jgi:hypothetical protein